MSANQPLETVAKLLNVSERRVQQLAHDGIIPKSADGKYHLLGCLTGYIKYLQSRKYNAQKENADEREMRARLLKAQTIKAEADAKKASGEILLEETKRGWADMILAFRAKIMALPYKITCAVIGLKEFHEIQSAVEDLATEAADELSTYTPKDESTDELSTDTSNDDAAEELSDQII